MGCEEGLLETHEPCVDGKRKEASPVDELEVLSTTAAMEDDTVSDGGDLYSTGSKRARCDGGSTAGGVGVDWRELPPGVLLRMLELLRANAIKEAEVARAEAAAAAAAEAAEAAAAEAGREEAEGEPAAEGAAEPQEAPPPPPPVGPSSGDGVEGSQDPRGPGVNEVMIASRVCKAWRTTALELLLGDTACSRPPRLATGKRGGKPANSEFSKRSTAAVVKTDDATAGKDKDTEEDSEAVSKPPLATTPQLARGVSSGSHGGSGADGRHGPVRTARRVQIAYVTRACGEEAEVSARAAPTASGDHNSDRQRQLGPQEGTTRGEGTLSDS